MATITTLARPYAKAAFEFATSAAARDDWSGMLGLTAAVAADPVFVERMRDPSLTRERKADDLLMVCEGSVTPEFGNFIRTLADNDRLLLIPDIARSEEHTSELQSRPHLVCRLLLEKKK